MRCVIGLGSNLGERWLHLGEAVTALSRIDPDLIVSTVFETAPVGGPSGQGPYLNCAVALRVGADPYALLERARELEQQAQRVRTEHWGPRTLDVDLLDIEGVQSSDPELTLPHPRISSRAFVLAPLEEVAPDLVDLGWRERLGGIGAVAAQMRPVGVLMPAPVSEAPQ
jgi:2-amino-4-hydroxy-6-hydroxymethyldihydropteridine diphosphokinase